MDVQSQFRENLLRWADKKLRSFPWREDDRSLYDVFVAEFFLTQTPAENVANVYPEFLDAFPSLEAINAAPMEKVEATIEPLGFQRMRADALSEIAAERTDLPTSPETLMELPRVGPYVANATICFALERPLPILDRNVVRTYERVFGDDFPEDDPQQREFAATILPTDGATARLYNLALLDFGAEICTKRDPACSECFASSYCSYFQSTVAGNDER